MYKVALYFLFGILFPARGPAQELPSEYTACDAAVFAQLIESVDPQIIIDVSIYDDYRRARLPQAFHADDSEAMFAVLDSASADCVLFFYSRQSERLYQALGVLAGRGDRRQVYYLDSEFDAWIRGRYPLERKRLPKRYYDRFIQE